MSVCHGEINGEVSSYIEEKCNKNTVFARVSYDVTGIYIFIHVIVFSNIRLELLIFCPLFSAEQNG